MPLPNDAVFRVERGEDDELWVRDKIEASGYEELCVTDAWRTAIGRDRRG
jgi:hypothetical protein